MEYMTYKEMEKYVAEMSKYKRKCKCNHVKTILPKHINEKGYEICSWCGRKVFYDKEEQKRYDFKEEIKKRI